MAELIERLGARGRAISRYGRPTARRRNGGRSTSTPARTPRSPSASRRRPGQRDVDNLDHALVERIILADVLGLDPADKAITYVGGDYPADWLRGEVDAGRAALAILIPPVTVDDFVAVNLARRKLPRKSTWFTPKARAGLVVAEL